jgi:hypothetical protein
VTSRWGGRGIVFQLLNGTASVVIRHNTAPQATNTIVAEGSPNVGFVYEDNLTAGAILGTGTAAGDQTLVKYFPESTVRQNVLIGGSSGQYAGTASCEGIDCFPASLQAVGFQDFSSQPGDWRLLNNSPYKGQAISDGGAPERTDVGADASSVYAVTAGIAN